MHFLPLEGGGFEESCCGNMGVLRDFQEMTNDNSLCIERFLKPACFKNLLDFIIGTCDGWEFSSNNYNFINMASLCPYPSSKVHIS